MLPSFCRKEEEAGPQGPSRGDTRLRMMHATYFVALSPTPRRLEQSNHESRIGNSARGVERLLSESHLSQD